MKKLSLRKESLRSLSNVTLAEVGGAGLNVSQRRCVEAGTSAWTSGVPNPELTEVTVVTIISIKISG